MDRKMSSCDHFAVPGRFNVYMLRVVFAILLSATPAACAIFSDVHWNTAIKLSRYEGYKSVSILSYNVPENSLQADFTFQSKTSSETCSFQSVYVYLQHGSYPLVDQYNETYPDHFYTNRTDAHHVEVKSGANITTYSISRPRPGLWYFAAFLPKATDSNLRIQQKGLDKTCMYGMFIMMHSTGVDNIEEILTNRKHSLHFRRDHIHGQKLYRFKLPPDTVSYTVTIDNCVMPSELSDAIDDNFTTGNDSDGNLSTDNDTNSSNDTVSSSSSSLPSSSSSNTSTTPTVKTTTETINTTEANSSSSSSSSSTTTTTTTTTTAAPASTTCPVVVYLQQEKLPSDGTTEKMTCTGQASCQKTILSPVLDKWIYIDVALDKNSGVAVLDLDLNFDVESCESLKMIPPNSINYVKEEMSNATDEHPLSLPQTKCITMDPLGRFTFSGRAFNVTFLLADPGPLPVPGPLYGIIIPDYTVLVTSIQIREPIDTGGTLKIKLDASNHALPDTHPQYAMVYICLMKDAIPGGANTMACDQGISLAVNTSGLTDKVVYVPYPEDGTYYIGFTAQCFFKTNHSQVGCSKKPRVDVDVGLSGCVDNDCGEYGVCQHYVSGVYLYSTCVCIADWRGYGCTDGSEARSWNEELTSCLLLTLTNLFFLPSIVVAIYRKYYVEAWVYLFTMFFSGFYHACDASNLVYYCLLEYDVLSFSDFVGSITSFWVTLLAMARIPQKLRWFGHMLGVMGVAVGTEYDRHGIWTFAIPAGLGLVVMFTSWIVQCRKRRTLYPPKRYYLFQFLPGLLLAAVGMILFAFFETEYNYKYTHSAWHMCMALCVVFLLPVRHKKEMNNTELKDVTTNSNSPEPDSTESSNILVNYPS